MSDLVGRIDVRGVPLTTPPRLHASSDEAQMRLNLLFSLRSRSYVAGVIYAFTKSSKSRYKIAPQSSEVGGIGKQDSKWKRQVQVIDESEGLKPEVLGQMKQELLLLRSKVVLDVEKELRAASDKSKGEMDTVFAEASELIACIDADSKRLHGDSAKVIGAEWMVEAVYKAQEQSKWQDVKFVKIPVSVTKLDTRMFAGCTALLAVELHDGVTEIGKVNSNCITRTTPNTRTDPPPVPSSLLSLRSHAARVRELQQTHRDKDTQRCDEAGRTRIQELHRAPGRGAARQGDDYRQARVLGMHQPRRD
jgi:hypothetical protein